MKKDWHWSCTFSCQPIRSGKDIFMNGTEEIDMKTSIFVAVAILASAVSSRPVSAATYTYIVRCQTDTLFSDNADQSIVKVPNKPFDRKLNKKAGATNSRISEYIISDKYYLFHDVELNLKDLDSISLSSKFRARKDNTEFMISEMSSNASLTNGYGQITATNVVSAEKAQDIGLPVFDGGDLKNGIPDHTYIWIGFTTTCDISDP